MESALSPRFYASAMIVAGAAVFASAGLNAYYDFAVEERPLSVEALEPVWIWAFVPFFIGLPALALAAPGFLQRSAAKSRRGAAAVHVLFTASVLVLAGLICIMAFVPPSIAAQHPEFLDQDEGPAGPLGGFFMFGFLTQTVAFAVFGLFHGWTRAMPPLAGVLVAVGAVLPFAVEPLYLLGDAALAAGFTWAGVHGWSRWEQAR